MWVSNSSSRFCSWTDGKPSVLSVKPVRGCSCEEVLSCKSSWGQESGRTSTSRTFTVFWSPRSRSVWIYSSMLTFTAFLSEAQTRSGFMEEKSFTVSEMIWQPCFSVMDELCSLCCCLYITALRFFSKYPHVMASLSRFIPFQLSSV